MNETSKHRTRLDRVQTYHSTVPLTCSSLWMTRPHEHIFGPDPGWRRVVKELAIKFSRLHPFPMFWPPKSTCQLDGAVYVGPKGVVRGVNKGESLTPEDPNSGHSHVSGLFRWP